MRFTLRCLAVFLIVTTIAALAGALVPMIWGVK